MSYRYTLIREDGSTHEIGEYSRQLSFKDGNRGGNKISGLYSLLDCKTIELIHRDYYPDADYTNHNVIYYGDEEARFAENCITNRHMKAIIDPRGRLWDVVGPLVRQEKING